MRPDEIPERVQRWSIHEGSTVPFVDLVAQYRSIQPEISEAIGGVLSSASFILGPDVSAFESELAAFLGCEFVVGVDSGISALELGLRALDRGPGDEAITAAILDRLLHHWSVINTRGESYRLWDKRRAGLLGGLPIKTQSQEVEDNQRGAGVGQFGPGLDTSGFYGLVLVYEAQRRRHPVGSRLVVSRRRRLCRMAAPVRAPVIGSEVTCAPMYHGRDNQVLETRGVVR